VRTPQRFVRLYIAPDVEFAYKEKYPFDPVEYVREHRTASPCICRLLPTAITAVLKATFADRFLTCEPVSSELCRRVEVIPRP
jgi:hypothetical protein